jgi:LSD1 subclass zinc finger protein
MNDFSEKTHEVEGKVNCKDCGALLRFNPGTTSLSCEYCGAHNDIAHLVQPVAEAEEIDLEAFLANAQQSAETITLSVVKCQNCGASTTLKPNVTADNCAFCGTALVIMSGSTCQIIKPKYMLPFSIDKKKGKEEFKSWLHKLWFAPNALKKFAEEDKLKGIYIPYWTYDSNTVSQYTGMRGDHYYTTETYTVNGQTQTRTVQRTRWTPASGTVFNEFDDVLINASNSLPEKYANELEPWDLHQLTHFNEQLLSGFQAEQYQLDVRNGFDKAKARMEGVIRTSAMRDIGGDVQQVLSLNSTYNDVTFKHILLPIWISAYRFKGKVYRFMINGRTGEVQGERPYSGWKIFFAVLAGLVVIGGIVYLIVQNKN